MVQLTHDQQQRVRADGAHEWHKKHQDPSRALPKCRDCRYFDAGDCNNPQLAIDLVNGLPMVECETARTADSLCGRAGAWFQQGGLLLVHEPPKQGSTLLAEVARVLATGALAGVIFAALGRWLGAAS
jgi:hypothetical protein